MDPTEPSQRVIGRRQSVGVGLTSLYSAAVAYVVLLVAARWLAPAENAEFLVFWSLLFGAFGVVTGVSPESARAAHDGAGRSSTTGAPIVLVGLAFGSLVALAIGATGIWWIGLVLPNHRGLLVVVVLACAAYSGHLALWGLLTGLRRWRGMAALMAAESTVRLVLLVAVVASGTVGVTWLAIASAGSAVTWTIALLLRSVRSDLRRRSDLDPGRQLRQFAISCAASSAGALLTVGFPTLLALTSPRAQVLSAAGVMLAVTLTRAPLLVPLTTFQGVALAHFLRHRDRGSRALLPILGAVGGLSILGAAVAWAIGGPLFSWLVGRRYTVDGATLAALVIAAGALAALTLTGMCCLAVRRTGGYALGWFAATAITVAVLAVPGDLVVRVVAGLLAGPAAGLIIQLVVLHRLTRAGDAAVDPSTRPEPR